MRLSISLLVFIFNVVNAKAQNFAVSEPVSVANGYGYYHPQIEVLGDGELGVIWTNAANDNLYFSKRIGMDQFSTPIKLNPDGLGVQDYNWSGADLSVWGNNVYVIFRSFGYETGNVYLVKSTDNGLTFGDTVRVDFLVDYYSQFPDIAVYQDTVFVTYMKHGFTSMDPQYVLSRSVDGGLSFEPEIDVTGWIGTEACDCCQPEIIVDAERVVIFYRENDLNTRDIKAIVSYDRGLTFNQLIDIDLHNWFIAACPSTGPDARFYDDNKMISAYRTSVSGQPKIFINEYDISNNILIDEIDVYMQGASNLGINFPQVACNNNLIAIVWEGLGNGTDVFFNAALNGISSINPDHAINVTPLSGSQSKPDIAIINHTFHIVYSQLPGSEVMYCRIEPVNNLSDNETITQVKCFPNPTLGEFTISIGNTLNESIHTQIFSSSGFLIEEPLLTLVNGVANYSVDHLPQGMYVMYFYLENSIEIYRIVKH